MINVVIIIVSLQSLPTFCIEVNYHAWLNQFNTTYTSAVLPRNQYVQDPAKRIGTKGGAKEVKEHPFFHYTDWTAFEQVAAFLVVLICSYFVSREGPLLLTCPNWRMRVIRASLIESSQTSHPTSPRSNWKQTKPSSVKQASQILASPGTWNHQLAVILKS